MRIGVNVTGAFEWAIFDNFEWFEGSHTKFGLQYLNETSLERYPKASFLQFLDWFKQKGGVTLPGSSTAGGNASQIPGK
jgi:beta-glucosidase/6-phospho-beta-glucosidase/beta-galactosidase